jgi:hypothetical protein
MGKNDFEIGNDDDDPKIELDVKVYWDDMKDVKLTIYRNGITIGSISYDNMRFNKLVDISHNDEFKFVCTGMKSEYSKVLTLSYSPNVGYEGFVNIGVSNALVTNKIEKSIVMGTVNYERDGEMTQPIGNIGKLTCYIE